MRPVASTVCWLVAVVAAVLTIPTLWVATHVADEDGYVELTQTFVDDPELQRALAAQTADVAARRTGAPDAVADVIESTVAGVAARLVDRPGFDQAWAESQRRTHRLTFGARKREVPPRDADRLAVDIGPVASFVVDEATGGLPVDITLPDRVLVPVYAAPDRDTIERVADTPERSRIGLVVVAAAAALCLLLARRRAFALVGLGVGAVLAGVVVIAATGLVLPEVLDRAPTRSPFARQMRDLLVDRAADSLQAWCVAVAVGGVIVIGVGAILHVAVGGRR